MTPPKPDVLLRRWNDVDPLFREALGLKDAERAELLDRRCAGDPELRVLVAGLLEHAAAANGFLGDPPPLGPFGTPTSGPPGSLEGLRLGAFELGAVLGWGGLGVVYRARRVTGGFQQEVAVKLLLEPTARELAGSLEREREILASLDHPGIARLLDGGTTPDGQPYLVMELVDGAPVTRYCDESGAGVRKRLRLFLRICEAVTGAHSRSVVHRDLKPSNILVTPAGDPKLLDFGIARLVTATAPGDAGDTRAPAVTLTRTGLRALSPAYASPEQVRGERVTVASDVFQLGTLLYELLTGIRPHEEEGRSPGAIVAAICDVEPPPPSRAIRPGGIGGASPAQARGMLQGDLDTIVMKALRKEPERRYASVAELAEDLRRHLDGRPVLARAASLRYRLGKFGRRHPLALAVSLTLVVAAMTALGWEATHAAEVSAERSRALFEAQRDNARYAAERAEAIPRVLGGSSATAINDRGVIIGEARNGFGDSRAVRWIVGPDGEITGPEDLGFTSEDREPGAIRPTSIAYDLTDDGLVIGTDARGPSRVWATLYHEGTTRRLNSAHTPSSFATRVNARGWVVGNGVDTGARDFRRGLVWTDPLDPDREPVQLPPLPGHKWSTGKWISDAGVAGGWSAGEAGWSEGVAVVWRLDEQGVPSLPRRVEADLAGIYSMNNSPSFVGVSREDRGMLLRGSSELIELPPLEPHERSIARGLNDPMPGGVLLVVGHSGLSDTSSGDRAVSWSVDAAGVVTGPTELGLTEGYSMAMARDANSHGWIVGHGSNSFNDRMAILWRPVEGEEGYEVIPLGTFGPGPTASFAHLCEAGGTCSFAGTSVPGNSAVLRQSWTSGAGEESDGQETVFTYSAPGRYVATLEVVDASGRKNSARVEITCTRRAWSSLRCS